MDLGIPSPSSSFTVPFHSAQSAVCLTEQPSTHSQNTYTSPPMAPVQQCIYVQVSFHTPLACLWPVFTSEAHCTTHRTAQHYLPGATGRGRAQERQGDQNQATNATVLLNRLYTTQTGQDLVAQRRSSIQRQKAGAETAKSSKTSSSSRPLSHWGHQFSFMTLAFSRMYFPSLYFWRSSYAFSVLPPKDLLALGAVDVRHSVQPRDEQAVLLGAHRHVDHVRKEVRPPMPPLHQQASTRRHQATEARR